MHVSRRSRLVTAKKCTKKRDAHVQRCWLFTIEETFLQKPVGK